MPSKHSVKSAKSGHDIGTGETRNGEVQTHGPPSKPDWPALEKAGEQYYRHVEHCLPGQIVNIHELFSASFCQRMIKFLSTLPLSTTPGQPKRGEAVRVNDRFQVEDWNFARQLWVETGMKDVVEDIDKSLSQLNDPFWGGEPVGLSGNIRIYRYKPGHHFQQHYDDSNYLTKPPNPNDGTVSQSLRTTFTLLIYLNDTSGGETVFYPEGDQAAPNKKSKKNSQHPAPISVSPEAGLALFHKHGKDCMLHEAKEVTSGEKWIIRSDLCVKR